MDDISPNSEQENPLPFRGDRWAIIRHYSDIALSEDEISSERFVDDCIARLMDIGKIDLLLELGAVRRQLEEDRVVLVSDEYLMLEIATWRVAQEEQRRRDGGLVTSEAEQTPLEHWAQKAWDCVCELHDAVLKAIEAVRNIDWESATADTAPPGYSPLAKLLYPYKDDFITSIPDLVSVLVNGSGRIDVATKRKADGALILNVIGQALNLSKQGRQHIELCFPNTSFEKSQMPTKWFTGRDEMNNLVNTTVQRKRKAYAALELRLELTRKKIEELIKTTPHSEL